ncbi:MAG: PHP domain-containing protein [Lachnospiraceae bacterium]|jgi:histidinol-phosphatase (PHP family)
MDIINQEKQELHCHTTFSDGANTPEEMVQTAIAMSLKRIGISDHSYTFFDERYCMPKSRISEYMQAVHALRRKYTEIEILCGVEQDYFSKEPIDKYDYAIGSVHYLRLKGIESFCIPESIRYCDGFFYIPVDESEETIRFAAKHFYDNDIYALIEDYYETVSRQGDSGIHIIGHFDVIVKFNKDNKLFDPAHSRYTAAWKKAVRKILSADNPPLFEINMSPVIRGLSKNPYPAPEIISYIRSEKGRLILTGDAHDVDSILN